MLHRVTIFVKQNAGNTNVICVTLAGHAGGKKMAKNNSKSIRMDDEVLAYIENYRGNGFNEKFANIILDAMKGESERTKILENLDKRIESSRKKLDELLDDYEKLNVHLQTALGIHSMINKLRKKLEEDIC